ncbi:MAG TPA: alpha/beta fold hydrolase [Thermoanaerobaculia bacterium]|nr:alpha/beta fold hydrolase [Thermoanaerobaculia bacterium]
MRVSFLAAALLLVSLVSAQESVEGYWQGAMMRDGSARIVDVDFFRDGDKLKARIRVGDWIAERPAVAVTQDGNVVKLELTPEQPATLHLDALAGEMVGTSGGLVPPIRVHLKRALRPVTVPVVTEDVRFTSGDVTLAGTLYLPPGAGPHPAVVSIHGRGKQTRAGFRGWARLLAERGVASLIYDKRGAGESTGNYDSATMHDLANDAVAAISFLARRKEIDAKQIGVRGNSAGGWVSAIVANRSPVPLAFIITTVGPADSVRDQQIHVAQYNMRRSGIDFTPQEYAAAAAHMGLVTGFAYSGTGWEALQESVRKAKTTRWARFVDLPEKQDYEDILWVRAKQYDPAADLSRIRTPFLALYGEDDYVVPPQENVPKLERYLKEAGNQDFRIVVVPKAGHGLSLSDEFRTLPGDVHYWLWPKLAPEALRVQVEWLLAHVDRR